MEAPPFTLELYLNVVVRLNHVDNRSAGTSGGRFVSASSGHRSWNGISGDSFWTHLCCATLPRNCAQIYP